MAEDAGLGGGRRQVAVPAQSGRAVSVRRGDLVQVVDIEGHQVGDLWAVDAADHGRCSPLRIEIGPADRLRRRKRAL